MFSIVTPTYNYGRFLPQLLDSVAALQTPHEHIVVDGASEDETVEVLEGREDPALRWVSEPDSGQTEAVNKGLRMAQGDLLAWVNADDEYIPEVVDRAIDHLDRHPDTGAVFGTMNYINEQGELFRSVVPPEFNWRRYLYLGSYLPTPTIIWRKELMRQAPSLNEHWSSSADYDFFLRLLRGVKVDRITEPMLNFRYHPASKSESDNYTQQSEARAIRLGMAKTPLQRGVMKGWERARWAILPRISNWPHPEPRGVVKLLQKIGARG
jgi:glycosyltransferase involved in cell wall biosynthesis